MATFLEQKNFTEELRLKERETRRISCPFCGGTNTFTANRMAGKVFWNCYKASCPTKGVIDTEMSASTIRDRLAAKDLEKDTSRNTPIPQHMTNVSNHDPAVRYLEQNNSLYAVENGLVKVKYAPAENRVLFFLPDGLSAVGRALDRRKPKWKVYGSPEGLLQVGSGSIGVVVEDAASACAVAMLPYCSGCALLGTHVTTLAKRQLRGFDQILIALDKDASKTSLKLQGKLQGRVPTKVVFLERDLKYLTKEELESIL